MLKVPQLVSASSDFDKSGTSSRTLTVLTRFEFKTAGKRRSQAFMPPAHTAPAAQPISNPQIDDALRPIVKHHSPAGWDAGWSLYWFPMKFGDPNPDPRMVSFLQQVVSGIDGEKSLHRHVFLGQECASPYLTTTLVQSAMDYLAVPILGARPEGDDSRFPTRDDVGGLDRDRVHKVTIAKNEKLRMRDYLADAPTFVYWIRAGQEQSIEQLTAQGGWSLFLSPLDADGFFSGVRELMASKISDPNVRAFPYLAPIVSSQTFIEAAPATIRRYFDLFTFCVAENEMESGITIFCRTNLDTLLGKLVASCGLKGPRRLWYRSR